jgi:putative transposase
MNGSLVYLLLRQILQMLTQVARDGGANCSFFVIRSPRCAARYIAPELLPDDRLLLAALSQLLPRKRWSAFFVPRDTVALARWVVPPSRSGQRGAVRLRPAAAAPQVVSGRSWRIRVTAAWLKAWAVAGAV